MNTTHDVVINAEVLVDSATRSPHTKVAEQKLAIIGLSNSGKTLLFNGITNTYSIVANYPHTTITPARKRIMLDNGSIEIIDTPGINSLTIQDDAVHSVLNIVLQEKPDILLVVGDAMRLKPSLMFLAQIQEMQNPTLF